MLDINTSNSLPAAHSHEAVETLNTWVHDSAARITQQLSELSEDSLRTLVHIAATAPAPQTPEDSVRFLQTLISLIKEPDTNTIEQTRRADPEKGEPLCISPDEILFIPKLSKIEWDMLHQQRSRMQLIQDYKKATMDVETIVAAHEAHTQSVLHLQNVLPESSWIQPATADVQALQQLIKQAKLIVIVGGDDHFKSMNPYLDNKLVAIVNSDVAHSEGAASYFTADTVVTFIEQIKSGKFLIEDWQRLTVMVNDTKYPSAISEIAIAEENFKFGSRGRINSTNQDSTYKGSGLIIGTGYGSTGWFHSAGRYLIPEIKPWARTLPYAHWVEREPYGDLHYPHVTNGALTGGEELVITSSMKHTGTLTIDSIIDVPFPAGSQARISLAPEPLHVVRSLE